nr:uncharacterized protein LOC124807786 [Hydra vulgaris]
MGVSKSMELCMRAGIHVTRDTVKQVVAECDECNSIDPNVMLWDKGNLAVSKVWERVACNVTHVDSLLYLTCIDCGPSRYTLWTPLSDESATMVVQALETIWSTLGPSSEVLLDNSKSLRSQLMQTMAAKWEIRLIYRAVEKPSENGIVEKVHRTVKRTNARVKCGISMSVFLINNVPSKHGRPFEIFCQHHKRVRIPGIVKIESTQKSMTECREWKVGDKVWVKPKHITPCTQRWLKGSIVALHNGLTAEVDVNGHTLPQHFSHLQHRRVDTKEEDTTDDFNSTLFKLPETSSKHIVNDDSNLQIIPPDNGKNDNSTGSDQNYSTDGETESQPVQFTRYGRRVLPNRKYNDYV